MIFYFTLFGSLILLFVYGKKTLDKGYLVSIQALMPLCMVLFLCLGPLIKNSMLIHDDEFNLIILVGLFGIIVAVRLIPYDILDNNYLSGRLYPPEYEIKKIFLNIGAIIYFVYLTTNIVIKVHMHGSIFQSIFVDRMQLGLGDSFLAGKRSAGAGAG